MCLCGHLVEPSRLTECSIMLSSIHKDASFSSPTRPPTTHTQLSYIFTSIIRQPSQQDWRATLISPTSSHSTLYRHNQSLASPITHHFDGHYPVATPSKCRTEIANRVSDAKPTIAGRDIATANGSPRKCRTGLTSAFLLNRATRRLANIAGRTTETIRADI